MRDSVCILLEMKTVVLLSIFTWAAALELFLVKNVQNNSYDCVSFEDGISDSVDNVFEATYMTHLHAGNLEQDIAEVGESGYIENLATLAVKSRLKFLVKQTNNETILSQFGFVFDHGWEGLPSFRGGVIDELTAVSTILKLSLWAKGPCTLSFGNFLHLNFSQTGDGLHAKVSLTRIEHTVDFLADRWNHFSLEFNLSSKRLHLTDIKNKSVMFPFSLLSWPKQFEKFNLSFSSDDGQARIKLHKYKTMHFDGSSIGKGIKILESRTANCLVISHIANVDRTFKIKSGSNQAYLKWKNRFFNIKHEPGGKGVQLEGKSPPASAFLAMRFLDTNCVPQNGHKQVYTRKLSQVPSGSKVTCMTVTNSKTVTENTASRLYWEDSSRLQDLCKLQTGECKGFVFCGEKGCTCVPPFTGPHCLDRCSHSSGYACGTPCGFCKSASRCEENTGNCNGCIKGYRSPQCTQRLLQFRLKPEIVGDDKYISLQKAVGNLTSEEQARIDLVEIQYKTENEKEFKTFLSEEQPERLSNKTYAIPKVQNGTEYQFRAVIIEKGGQSFFNNTDEAILKYTFPSLDVVELMKYEDNGNDPLIMVMSILGSCLAVAVLLILTGCLCKMRRVRPPPAVLYSTSIREPLYVTANREYDADDETNVKSIIYYDTPQENIYDEIEPLREEANPGMTVQAYKYFVENSIRDKSFKKQFKAIKEAAGLRDMDYVVPLSGEIVLEQDQEFRTRSYYYDGFMCSKRYICAECPTRKDVSKFWGLVVQENVQSIVLLTDSEEYWPQVVGTEITFDSVHLSAIERYSFCHFDISTISISTGGESKTVRHLHFKNWIQNELPRDHLNLAQFIEKINPDCHKHGPILIQCSTKMSRIGIIMFVHMCREMISRKGIVHPEEILSFMLKQSVSLMGSHKQYMFANLVLLECSAANRGMLCANFEHFYKILLKDRSVLIQSHQELTEQISKDAECRNCLAVPSKDTSLNLTIADGYAREKQFILIPTPTAIYFWGLVTQQKVQQVVILNESITKTVGFLPRKGAPLVYGNLNLSLEEVQINKIFESMQIRINDSAVDEYALPSKFVNLMIFRGWKENTLPSVADLVTFWNESEAHRGGPKQTLLVCTNGFNCCGLYLAVGLTIEKIKLEQLVDINWPIRKLCQEYENMTLGIDEYKFILDATADFLERYREYSNFS